METLKKLLKHLIYPHIAIILLLIPVCATLLTFSFLRFESDSVFSIVSYVISAYTLTVLCLKTPYLIRFFKRFKENNRYMNRWATDAHLRVKLSLYVSLAMNTAYALLQFGMGLWHHSFWFHSLAIYYLLLVIMRFFLLRDVRGAIPGENRRSELHRYRFCGILLLLMNLALISMVFFITYFGRGVTHHAITTIALAAYTFGAMTLAIVNLIKYRRYQSPLYSAAKVIQLAAASVSMLTLETAMFSAFGGETSAQTRHLMTLLTGIGVCLFVMALAIYMIIHSTKELKKTKTLESKEA
ncbi:MAG: hypothetical protein IJW44_00600 [Clostridia bacterium]|nr:hypothetical protein [Clostridia bacterium]